MPHIHKILIANRGEIALRIMRTCRAMGISTVAVFSDADEQAPFVAYADEAVRLGPAPASESYLAIDKILAAAARTGADAIHPGYGFLAENASFAAACAAAGVTFIGPRAEVIRSLGSKREAKQIAIDADVPVIPGDSGADQSVEALAAACETVGFPVLLKASAGGGGKGMRVVRERKGLAEAIESAKREARSAFGDDTMLIEKYIECPRHVEIQILGDQHGNLLHLFERECSIQRRHQKIIEESPSPALDEALRAEMGAAAVRVGKAVGYTNAGTVEFILGPDRKFYFLEVNTRLQVEHPVTECITGLDLVREQIRIARGERLGLAQDALSINGAAIECRLYAEDPAQGYLPTSGRIVDWRAPEDARMDSGIDGPADVSIYYDPMLAKLICHAPTRAEAIDTLVRALRELSVQGIVTNREFLIAVLRHPAFAEGALDTHFLERHADTLAVPAPTATQLRDAAIAAALADVEARRRGRELLPALEPGYRNVRNLDPSVRYAAGERELQVHYRNLGRGRFACRVADDAVEATLVAVDGDALTLEIDGLRRRVRVIADGARRFVHGLELDVSLVEQPRFPDAAGQGVAGGCLAPMPGAVVKVLVSEGQAVEAGETLLVLEAMKMELAVKAPEAGVVAKLPVREGDKVGANELLAVIAPPG